MRGPTPGGTAPDDLKPVETLDLHKKRLGPLSGVVIAHLVRINPVLTALNLASNALGVAGASALAAATAHNTSLATVDLRQNKLDAEAKAQVRSVAPLAVGGRLLVSTPDSDRGDDPAANDGGRGPGGKLGAGTNGATKTGRPKAAGVGGGTAGGTVGGSAGKGAAGASPLVGNAGAGKKSRAGQHIQHHVR